MPTHMTIKSVSNNGEFLPPADLQDRIDQLERDYWNKTIDNEAKRSVETSSNIYNNPYGYNMNYYGYSTYGSGYFYNPVDQEIAKEIDKIKEEARENRRKLNIQISKHRSEITLLARLKKQFKGKKKKIGFSKSFPIEISRFPMDLEIHSHTENWMSFLPLPC